jgi:acetyl esterase/lipase
LPASAWLISPWTDLTMSGTTLDTKDAVDPIIHKGYLDELADAYVPTLSIARTRSSRLSSRICAASLRR